MYKGIVIAAALLLSTNVLAGPKESGPYLSLGGHVSKIETDDFDLNFWGTTVSGGYRFNPNLAMELSISEQRLDDKDEGINFSGDATRIGLSVLVMPPITDSLDAYVALKYDYATVSMLASYSDGVQKERAGTDSGFGVGVGLMWHVTDSVFIRSGVGTTVFDDSDVTNVSIDVGVQF